MHVRTWNGLCMSICGCFHVWLLVAWLSTKQRHLDCKCRFTSHYYQDVADLTSQFSHILSNCLSMIFFRVLEIERAEKASRLRVEHLQETAQTHHAALVALQKQVQLCTCKPVQVRYEHTQQTCLNLYACLCACARCTLRCKEKSCFSGYPHQCTRLPMVSQTPAHKSVPEYNRLWSCAEEQTHLKHTLAFIVIPCTLRRASRDCIAVRYPTCSHTQSYVDLNIWIFGCLIDVHCNLGCEIARRERVNWSAVAWDAGSAQRISSWHTGP